MRIVHLVSSGQLGGTEASVIEMTGSVARAEPAWRVSVTTAEHGPFEQRLREEGIAVDVRPFPDRFAQIGEAGRVGAGAAGLVLELVAALPGVERYRRGLRAALLHDGVEGPPDIVHAHGFKMQVLGALSLPPRARLVWHLHDYVSGRPISGRLLRRLSPRVALMIANSASVAADVRRVCGTRVPIVTIYNAVDTARFAPEGNCLDLDACAGLQPAPPGTLRIGLIGTFAKWKGHTTFLAAIAKLPFDRPVRAYIIGGAQYRTAGSQHSEAALRSEALRLGISDRVAFTGPVTDPAAAIRALDVVVHASTQPEPFGMVIAEAMACARPVVISRAGGAAELVADGVDGLSHAPGDAGGLSACLARLVSDSDLRRRLGAAARATACRRFDRRRLAGELIPLYTGLEG